MRTKPVGPGPHSICGRAQGQAIPRGLAALEVSHGDGRVILLGMRPQWRGQPFGNFRIVFNAALYGASVAAAGPANPDFWEAPEEEEEEERGN